MPTMTYRRLDLAQEQLEVALDLFLEKKSLVAAITLAGAAEEVLGKELQLRGKTPALEWKFEETRIGHNALHRTELDRKVFVKAENRIRNALKHFDATDGPAISVDIEEAACWMLVRACENASRLNLIVRRRDEFDAWFHTEIVGIEISIFGS